MHRFRVSLFTREWIEIGIKNPDGRTSQSPSLRGSGLKSYFVWILLEEIICLPLYEGVDWNVGLHRTHANSTSLPLYEGVDWNRRCRMKAHAAVSSPSLRGSGLKCWMKSYNFHRQNVSLFTREWIEMLCFFALHRLTRSSPSLRGSGLKWLLWWVVLRIIASPSLRGSGLKSARCGSPAFRVAGLPLYEGVDWNFTVSCP